MQDTRRALPSILVLCPAMLALLLPCPGRAASFYLQDQSARGTGRAYSGEAADQGPDSLWWDPASIAGLQRSEIDSNLTGIVIWSAAKDGGSTIDRFGQVGPVGGDARTSAPVSDGVLPSGGAALRLNDAWSIGIALTSPFSFTTKYGPTSWARYDALTSRLQTIDAQPTLAWRPFRWLGLGGGPNVEHSLAALSSALPNLAPGQPDGLENLHVNGWNVGYNLGLQLHLLDDRLTFGAAYRSRIRHSLSGDLDVSGLTGFLAGQNFYSRAARANFTTPWAATFGLRYRATPRLTLDAEVVHTGWSVFDEVDITQPINSVTSENYGDVTSEAFGLDYAVTTNWILRAGVQYDPTPTPSVGRELRVPDADRVLLALGTTVKVTQRFTVDFGASYIDAGIAHIDRNATAYAGTPVAIPVQLQGKVDASGLILALGTRLQF